MAKVLQTCEFDYRIGATGPFSVRGSSPVCLLGRDLPVRIVRRVPQIQMPGGTTHSRAGGDVDGHASPGVFRRSSPMEGGGDVDECLAPVWRLAIDSGLAEDRAAEVCVVTLLRLLDEDAAGGSSRPYRNERALRIGVEETRIGRRLAAWHGPRLVRSSDVDQDVDA